MSKELNALIPARVQILRPTRHKIHHFRDVLPRQSFRTVLQKLDLTQQKHKRIHK